MCDSKTGLPKAALILGVSIVAGLGIAGFFISDSIKTAKKSDRYVTVRGLAEREVSADLAIWPLKFVLAENDLGVLQTKIQKNRLVIRDFLCASGFDQAEISNPPPAISDRYANSSDEKPSAKPRYTAEATVLLRTSKIGAIKKTMEQCDKLVQNGIVLGNENYSDRIQFMFTGLNAVKPDMIQEATKNARSAADKFAQDSNQRATHIRRASQGFFEINDLDSSSPDKKIVRVVTTVDYFLE